MDFFGIDLITLIQTVGLAGLMLIVFAETGLFIGFFLPGDSLLFVAGLLAAPTFSTGAVLNIWTLIPAITLSAILGNVVGYGFGRKVGEALFEREDSLLFKKHHLRKAHYFYEKYGPKVIVIARFMPIVRTFAPIVAGMARMNFATFMKWNILGAILWCTLLPLLGYGLGSSVENIDRYILPIVVAIIILSILPGVIAYIRERNKK
jgi:membrane-associated protein